MLGRLLAVRHQVQNEVVCGMCQSVVGSLQMELGLGERMDPMTLWSRAQEVRFPTPQHTLTLARISRRPLASSRPPF